MVDVFVSGGKSVPQVLIIVCDAGIILADVLLLMHQLKVYVFIIYFKSIHVCKDWVKGKLFRPLLNWIIGACYNYRVNNYNETLYTIQARKKIELIFS